jgi:hypothetical protein
LASSKKTPKLDLGEAYLKAQETKIAFSHESAKTKSRCDFVVALTLQGKTPLEITVLLDLAGLGF